MRIVALFAALEAGLGNLSTKNRLRDRFSSSKSRQVTGQRFSGPNFGQDSRKGFSDGRQNS